MIWMTIIRMILEVAIDIKNLVELTQFLDKRLKPYGGLYGFSKQMGIPVDAIVDYAREQLGLDSEDSDNDFDSEDSDETATVMCPHCQGFVVADDGNGTYSCEICDADFEVGVFDGAFTPQYDNNSSGWAVAEWLVKSFDVESDSEEIRSQLEDSHEEDDVTDPDVFLQTMQGLGLEVWVPDSENGKRTIFRSRNTFANWIFESAGRIAVCFQYADRRLGRHWVGLELHDGEVRVMDPIQAQGYMSLEDWCSGIEVGRIVAVYGFTN